MKYRKKPVVVEAIQLTNKNLLEVKEWCNGELVPNAETSGYDLYISTLEGIMHADINDYIIQGVEGEFYPCKPDIFEKTYEVASQQSQLDDNQKIVLERLKINAGSKGSLIKAIHSLYNSLSISPGRLEKDGAEELLKARNALARLPRKQAAEVLAAFAQWGLGQEEE
ncbi:hypothetical protein [Lactococcus lactis]|uniref:hypothetical protein n=1 Tax=Lactococcus lactis TaxID=1358 RepID=UPI002B1CE103|nr:hypothetical protein [Lactococcus lactis]